jgi:hypothetical protein
MDVEMGCEKQASNVMMGTKSIAMAVVNSAKEN